MKKNITDLNLFVGTPGTPEGKLEKRAAEQKGGCFAPSVEHLRCSAPLRQLRFRARGLREPILSVESAGGLLRALPDPRLDRVSKAEA